MYSHCCNITIVVASISVLYIVYTTLKNTATNMEGNKFDGPWDEPIVNEPPIVLQYWSAKRSANFGIFCWSVAYCFPKHLWLNPDFAAYHLSLDMWYYIYIQWYTYIEIVIKYRSEILKCYLSSWCLGTGTMEVIFLLYRIFPRVYVQILWM